ncbi:hypothetical protein M758_1G179000 [Ceratodon purpureus]|uniref:Flagellar associated protein n=1 Tax=Ceratodon purpureus TaxID=3225 RepID=A0A8T0J6I1_CERPU|nr:hypothetical protein KC19_1G181900 [Ceratodon purpureus]KAG0630454.1 hypothetical protein M758_1G179000 [Ceratodon purpureus]
MSEEKSTARVPYWEAFRLDRTWKPQPPRVTRTKSACFGPQFISNRATAPCIGFGTGSRYAFERMFVNSEMAAKTPGNNSPGPVYKSISSFGKQPESQCESPAEVKIGTAKRWSGKQLEQAPGPGAYLKRDSHVSSFGDQVQSEKRSPEKTKFTTGSRAAQAKMFVHKDFDKEKWGLTSPGPKCPQLSTFGYQNQSGNRTAPVVGFTKGLRTLRDRGGESAGPGEYPIKGAVGKQPESQRVTLPSFSFPLGTREARDKTFLSREHDKSYMGQTNAAGPGQFGQTSSVGNQILSKCANPPFIRFTKGTRWNKEVEDLPGPGTYDPA